MRREKITSNLNGEKVERFIRGRLNSMLNILFEANEEVKMRSKHEQTNGRIL